jgi:hypothetical protein
MPRMNYSMTTGSVRQGFADPTPGYTAAALWLYTPKNRLKDGG